MDSLAFEIAEERKFSDQNFVKTDAKELIRFVCKRRESVKPIGIDFGNGINGRWAGYYSKGFQEFVVDVDGSTLLPLREKVDAVTVDYGEWKQADTVLWVPGFVSVRHEGTQWDMYFDWLADSVWLLKEAELVSEIKRSMIARTLNIRVNDQDVVRKLTERE